MTTVFQLALILLLGLIAWQDFRFRAVNWIFFPVFLLLAYFSTASEVGYQEAFLTTGINIGFLSINLLFVFLYLSIKNKTIINFTGDFFGWGDILFLVALAALVSPANFILFFIASLMLVCLLVLIIARLRNSIPLAGLQSVFLLPVFVVNWFSSSSLFHNQQWLDDLLF